AMSAQRNFSRARPALLALATTLCVVSMALPAAARVVVGFGFGVPVVPAPWYYAPPPVVYAPPPVVYSPPPVVVAPPPQPAYVTAVAELVLLRRSQRVLSLCRDLQ